MRKTWPKWLFTRVLILISQIAFIIALPFNMIDDAIMLWIKNQADNK